MAVATNPKLVRAAAKAGSVSAVARRPEVRIQIKQGRDDSLTVDQQRAQMIVAYFDANPGVAALVDKARD